MEDETEIRKYQYVLPPRRSGRIVGRYRLCGYTARVLQSDKKKRNYRQRHCVRIGYSLPSGSYGSDRSHYILYILCSYNSIFIFKILNLRKIGGFYTYSGTENTLREFSDSIFERDRLPAAPINAESAVVISCEESRAFLSGIGIHGEIIHTPSHSVDSVSLILDGGDCFVGDLEPYEHMEAYEENPALKRDWERIASFRPKRIFYAHRPEQNSGYGLNYR